MSHALPPRLRASLEECRLHDLVLARDLELLPASFSVHEVGEAWEQVSAYAERLAQGSTG